VLLGPKWIEAVPLIQVFALFGIIRSVHGPTGSIYLAIGKPRFVAFLQCLQLLVAVLMMVVLVPQLKVLGAAWSILVGAAVATLTSYTLIGHELDLRLPKLLAALWRPIAAAAAMALVVSAIGPNPPADATTIELAWRLIAVCLAAGVAYLAVILGCWALAGKPAGPEQQVGDVIAERFTRRLAKPHAR
jgi:O-antigen/teichoic acid export membrane protein